MSQRWCPPARTHSHSTDLPSGTSSAPSKRRLLSTGVDRIAVIPARVSQAVAVVGCRQRRGRVHGVSSLTKATSFRTSPITTAPVSSAICSRSDDLRPALPRSMSLAPWMGRMSAVVADVQTRAGAFASSFIQAQARISISRFVVYPYT